MKFLYPLILAAYFTGSAQAAWVVPAENLACRNDFNPWGYPGSCQCPVTSNYNQKIGKCTIGDPYHITVSGVLHSADASTQGATLETEYGTFNLAINLDNLAKVEKADGLYFEVGGEFLLLEKEPTIVVDRLSWLD